MMYLYDKSLELKLKRVFDRVVYSPIDTFYERYLISNKNQDPVQLPALSLWRTSYEFDPYSARSQLATSNFRIAKNDKYLATHIYSMKVQLNYQLDIWAATDVDRDDLLQEILFFLTVYPNVVIEYQGEKFSVPILIEPPRDTTDIANFDRTGDFYRVTIPLQLPDARLLFYQDAKTCRFIDVSVFVDGQLDHKQRIPTKEG